MTNYAVENPYPVILGTNGSGLNAGSVYIGVAGQDPETNPVTVYWDVDGTNPASQPLTTIGGYIWNAGSPAQIYGPSEYSIRVRDRFGAQVFYDQHVGGPLADFIDSLTSTAGAGLVGYDQDEAYPAGSVGARLKRFICINDAPYNAGPARTGAQNSAAFNDAIADIDAAGGGDIWAMVPGTYTLANSNPGAGSWDDRRCIYIDTDNVALRFAEGVVLRLGNSEDAHVIQLGSRAVSSLSVHNVTVYGATIDGNRVNQSTPTVSDNHWNGINVSSGCTNINISTFHIHDCQYYGIGFQNDAFESCHVDNGLIENTGADGIDCKDINGTSKGNTITRLTVKNFGLSGGLTPQGGINPRPGWMVDNVTVSDFSGANHGIRFDHGGGATNDQPQILSNFYVSASSEDTTVGVYINSSASMDEVQITNGRVTGCNVGVDSRAIDTQVSNVRAKFCGTGIQINQRTQVSNCAALDCDVGLNIRGSENIVTNFSARSNVLGAKVEAGSTLSRILGGMFTGNTTNLTDSGTQTAVEKVSGIRTYSAGTANFSIGSTGVKTVAVAHNLDFTPNIDDVIVSIKENTAVDDWALGYVKKTAVDATNVTLKINVTTASATGAATATASIMSITKKAIRQ